MDGWTNKLFLGDNLGILREHVPDESVDLIYLDPPFNSNATYNVLFKEQSGEASQAQITAFEDTWHWGTESAWVYSEVVKEGPRDLANLVQALRAFLGENDMMAYLTMMAPRLVELHRVLKPTGSLYLHCDPTASHYIKLLLDAVFGARNFRNEIVWKRYGSHGNVARSYASIHDVLFYYVRSDQAVFNRGHIEHDPEYIAKAYRHVDENGRRYRIQNLANPDVRPNLQYAYTALNGITYQPHPNGWKVSKERMRDLDEQGLLYYPRKATGRLALKSYLDEMSGPPIPDIWADIKPLSGSHKERLGYPTQKPESLLERIIEVSSNEGDLLLDPFCGCGTAVAVAERLNRRWIGIDITHLAITLMKHRLHDTFREELSPYQVQGAPTTVEDARALLDEKDGRYQFEWWALGLIDARPAHDRKKGADTGIDGYINFFDDGSGKAKTIIIQVKSGKVTASQVRDLKGVMEREKAPIGAFLTLEEPTRPMITEAASAGFYEPPSLPGKRYPRVQLLTIQELLDGKTLLYPEMGAATFQRAQRRSKAPAATQGSFGL